MPILPTLRQNDLDGMSGFEASDIRRREWNYRHLSRLRHNRKTPCLHSGRRVLWAQLYPPAARPPRRGRYEWGDAAGADADGLRLLVHLVPRVGAALDRVGDVVRGLILHLETGGAGDDSAPYLQALQMPFYSRFTSCVKSG